MADQEGLRFLFDINDKITAKLARIEAKSKAAAKNIDKAFTRSSNSQQANLTKLAAIEQRRVAAAQSNSTKLAAIAQRSATDAQKATERVVALAKRESDARTRSAAKSAAAEKRRTVASQKAHEKALLRIKRESAAFKRSMTRLASAAAVAFAAVAGKALSMASGYDAAMRSVQAKTGATGEFMDRLSEQSREMGRTTVHSATEAARGQAFLAQAGFDANEILSALPATLALATAGELDLASAADIASNVLSGFQLATTETGRVADVLAFAASKTNTSVLQLGSALAKAAPAARAAGWSIEETTAAIGKLSDAGIQGEEAGTTLNTMLAKLSINGGPAEKLLAKLGITVKDTTGQMLPLNDILSALAPHAGDVGLQMELLGTRGAKAGFILGAVAQDARELTGQLENSGGAAQSMADTMSGGLWGAIKSIQSIIESAYISLGERFAPAVEKIAKLFAKLPAPIQEVVVVVGSLAAAMGGLMLLMPQSFGAIVQFPGKLIGLAKSIKGVTSAQLLYNAALTANPIGLVVAAVALLAGGLYLLYTKTELGREALTAIGRVAKVVFVTAINLAWAAIKWLAKWAVIAKDKIVKMIPKWVIKSVELLGEKVAVVTGKIKDFNKRMEESTKEQKKAAKVLKKLTKEQIKAEKAAAKLAKEQENAAESSIELTKAQQKAAVAATEAAEAAEEAAKAAAKEAKAVQDLADSWTGATLDSGKFLRAYQSLTPAQKENDRIMAQVLNKYDSLRKVHGPFNKELEAQWQATVRLNPELAALNKEQEKLEKAAQALNERLADQRRRLLGLPTDAARRAFEDLTRVWEGLNDEVKQGEVLERYRELLLRAAEAGHDLKDAQLALIETTETAKAGASGYELALAGIAGEMGDATSKALNLVIAMREHNEAQKVAAGAGKKTEASFGKMRVGAGNLALAFAAAGDAIGGTSGKIMNELAGIAAAFATGGIAGGITASVIALGKVIIKFFNKGKKRRAAARAKAKAEAEAAEAAAAKIAEAMAAIRRELLNLPTLDAVEDFKLLRDVWDAMNPAERAQGMENYAVALQEASAAGILLKDVEQTLLDAFVARNAALKEAAARQNAELDALAARQAAEMAGIDTQIDAIETRLRAKINELGALLKQQDAELDALSSRQDAELEALAARRQESLDAMTAVQNERLAVLKAAQAAELNALKAAQAEALSALKAARAAALGVIEAAIQRELEDERIAAQLIIDLRKAGGDQEAIDAAHARAATSTERLLERDELNDLMAEAEKRVRARYQDEIDTINAHFDKLETITTENFEAQQAKIEAAHADQLTAMEAAAAAERKEHNDHWDLLEKLMKLQHAAELKLIQEAHKAQLEELLASLKEQRQVLADGHAVELADLQSAHAAQLAEIERYWIAAKQAHEEGMAAINAVADRPPWAEGTGGGTGGPGGRYGAWWRPPGQQRPSDPVSPPGERQHGGPVRRGGLYLVGEGGPEMFVPSQSGRIEPHGSSGGGVDAKVLARAVADALEGTEIKVDGRKLGRLTVRHQPLAVAELGGRR